MIVAFAITHLAFLAAVWAVALFWTSGKYDEETGMIIIMILQICATLSGVGVCIGVING